MERSFYNEDFDFEELIKHKSDQYKIYPSDKVWRGIQNSLHPTRKWYWLGLVLILGGFSYYAVEQFSSGTSAHQSVNNKKKDQLASGTPAGNEAVVLPFTPPRSAASRKKTVDRNSYVKKGLVVAMSEAEIADQQQEAIPLSIIADARLNKPAISTDRSQTIESTTDTREYVIPALKNIHPEQSSLFIGAKTAAVSETLADETVSSNSENAVADNISTDEKRINWLQENAVYELTRPRLKRVSWQVIASPTMNYRRLTSNANANISSDSKIIPIALNIEGDVDRLANHKPALGFEVGSMLMYALNKNVTFKTGVQFNFSRYYIQAYRSNSPERATIALNSFYRPTADSITSYTLLRNFGGNSEKGLENKYYELSTPIGVDVLVLGRGRLQLSVGGTIQPTYLINRDNYLITTDYKNYIHEPSLVRRWNVNASAEAFLSYKAAGFKFQVGPQFRYQLFSTYSEKYPIKEFLMEYGVRLGVSKTLR